MRGAAGANSCWSWWRSAEHDEETRSSGNVATALSDLRFPRRCASGFGNCMSLSSGLAVRSNIASSNTWIPQLQSHNININMFSTVYEKARILSAAIPTEKPLIIRSGCSSLRS